MKILIVKLGAKGDVIRTLSVLPAIKKKFPESEIHWVTKENIADLLKGHPLIDNLFVLSDKLDDEYDLIYNFDIEKEATDIAEKTKAKNKLGFYSQDNYPCAFNIGAEYYLNTIFDDELKKNNKKTYQQMIFEAADLSFSGEKQKIYLNDKDKKYASDFISENNLSEREIIGIHMGSSPRWPSKAWSLDKLREFISLASKNYSILLFGGPDELDKFKPLLSSLSASGINIHHNNPSNTNREFASLISICNHVVCADSFALHLSLALDRKTTGLFFCTSPYEIEGYGLLEKVVSPMLPRFFPEKMDQYSEELVNSISAEEVLKSINA